MDIIQFDKFFEDSTAIEKRNFKKAEMAYQRVIGKLEQEIQKLHALIEEMPQKGDREEDCQKLTILASIKGLEMAVNGCEVEDFIALETVNEAKKELTPEVEKITDILEELDIQYDLYYEEDELCGFELNSYTDGGVNMIIFIDFRNGREEDNTKITFDSFCGKFNNFIENFDIDEEIDLHRESEGYRNNFTIRESVIDFEDYEKWLKKIYKKLCKK